MATTVQRQPDPAVGEAKRWAIATNTQVESTQDAVSAAQGRLNAEAKVAIDALRAAQATYESYEKRYEIALTTFKSNVAAAQAAEAALRETLETAATFALAEFSPLYVAVTKSVADVSERIEKAIKNTRAGRAGLAAKGLVKDEGAKESSKDLIQNKTDWKSLLSTALTSFQTNLDGNAKLTAMSGECISTVRFLGRVRDGTYSDGVDPRTTADGQTAEAMDAEADATKGSLAAIGTGSVSLAAVSFQQAASRQLDKITTLELERQIATRWISSLGKDQLDEIDTAEAYLKQIKVIGPGSELGYDTGWYTSEDDEKMVKMVADVENTARSLVGQGAEWLGRSSHGRARIRDDHNRTWYVTGDSDIGAEGGGSVTIIGYKIDKTGWDMDSWEWSQPANLRQQLFDDVSFKVVANGPTGGGVTAAGPVLNAN